MYVYLKCIVYDKLLKPRQSLRITLYYINVIQYKRPAYIRTCIHATDC